MSVNLERHIIAGLIASAEYAKRVKDIWRDDLIGSPELRRIAKWCLAHFERYQCAPGRGIEQIFLDAVRDEGIPKAEAGLIEDLLHDVSKDWTGGDGTVDVDHLFDLTARFFLERRLNAGKDDVEGLLARGDVDQVITAMAETAADAIEMAPAGDLSRARNAGWRIATAGGPEERLSDPWGEPEPPPFDLTMLPYPLREFVEAESEMIGVGRNAMAWSTLAACGAALDSSIRLQLKPTDFSFTVPPGIWLLLVGPPSSRKSPILKAALAPLEKIQAERIKAWERQRAAWLGEDPKTRGPEPTFVQLLTNSQTPEGIRDALVGQDRGITVLVDEWASHIGAMGRYSASRGAASADRGFYNQAFDGGPFTVNRANRKGGDRIAVANLQINVIGGVQPDVLRQFNRNGELLGDGMLQRSCPILMNRPRPDREIDAAGAITRYGLLIRRLVEMSGNSTVHMSTEAEAIRRRLGPHFMALEQNEALGQGFATAAGKLQGIWGRLALTLQHVLSAHRDDPPEIVGERAAAMAERLVKESLIPNLAAFYQSLGTGDGDIETTRAIAGFLLRQQRVRVTGRDIQNHVSALHRSKVEQVRDAVSPLVNMGWLTPEGDDERRARGWVVNPAIYAQFAERAAKAKVDAAMARSLIAKNAYNAYRARDVKSFESPFLYKNGEEAPGSDVPPRARDKHRKHSVLGAKVRHNLMRQTSWASSRSDGGDE